MLGVGYGSRRAASRAWQPSKHARAARGARAAPFRRLERREVDGDGGGNGPEGVCVGLNHAPRNHAPRWTPRARTR